MLADNARAEVREKMIPKFSKSPNGFGALFLYLRMLQTTPHQKPSTKRRTCKKLYSELENWRGY